MLALAFATALAATPTEPPAPSGMAGMGMDAPAPTSSTGMAPMAGMAMGAMRGDLGGYPTTRDASGTAWQPDSSPMTATMRDYGPWSVMVHGYATLVYDDQGGGRGANKTFVESMLMGMAQRPLTGGVLTLRAMGSADPLMGGTGYPLLLATGETADGRTPLVDRQHPHDLVMEVAGVYSRPIGADVSGFLYVGWPGEPALGPATYMHRFSGMANPEAPIDHHWLDSTHITFGVVTAGLVRGGWKLEASSFTGREPNQHRYDFDHPRFDSWSTRLSWNPTADLALQVSYGRLASPEQLEPEVDQRRTTASATYNRAYRGGDWQTTLAWGRDENLPGHRLDAYLLDSAASLGPHTVFGRLEFAQKDELFDGDEAEGVAAPPGPVFDVGKLSLGYYHTTDLPGRLALDLGGLVSRYDLPRGLDAAYGRSPTSFMLFTRVKVR